MDGRENYLVLPKITDQSILARYYSMADVFVICSKRENFPTTCIEAQCCGTPVVGFDTGGTKETLVDSKDNLVEYGDINALKEKVESAITRDTDSIANKSQNIYSKDNMLKKYMDEYDANGRKERVLLIDVNCKYSSTGKIVYDLYRGIQEDGREAAICYGRGKLVKEKNIYKFGVDYETVLHAFLSRITGYNGCFSPLSTKRLIHYIDQYNPDVIHIHELHAYFVNLKPLLKYIKKKDIPVIWTFHCEYMYTGKCGHSNECSKFQTECHNCPAVKEYPKSIFFDQTQKMFNMKKNLLEDMDMTIVTPSQWLSERVKKSFLRDKPIQVINNGIDTNVFHSTDDGVELKKELGIPENYKVALAVAPDIMSDRKGGKLVLKLAEIMEDEKLFWILVGDK
jgi:glycosyltransferase involved in cell wall biosynthesis